MILFALSDIVQQSLINAVFGFLGVVVLAWINRRQIAPIKENVQKVEKATNSMKDALVLATEKEALARGGIEERARADAKKEKEHGKS
jgi:hypothetical protein